jgi:hypothetical protein
MMLDIGRGAGFNEDIFPKTMFHFSQTFKISFAFLHIVLELFFFGFYLLAQLAEADSRGLSATVSTAVLDGLCVAMFVAIGAAFSVKFVQELCVRGARRGSRALFVAELVVWLLCLAGVACFLVLLIGALLNEVVVADKPTAALDVEPQSDWTAWFDSIQGEYVLFLLFAVRHWRSLPSLGWTQSAFLHEPAAVVATTKFRVVAALEFVCTGVQLAGYMFFIAAQHVDKNDIQVFVVCAFVVVQLAFLLKFVQELWEPLRVRRSVAFVIQCALWLFSVVAALFFVVLFVFSLITASAKNGDSSGEEQHKESRVRAAFEEAQGPFILFLFFTVRTWRHLPTLGPSRSAFLEVHTHLDGRQAQGQGHTERTKLVNRSEES